jgi:predicted aldo/keto reductase-like oxidoreductase
MPGSAEELSVLGFGAMRLPTRVGGEASSLIDKDAALRQIRMAIDAGVNYLDTAAPYHLGASETFLGEHVLSDSELRPKINIATKLPCMLIRKREAIQESFHRQLEKLRVDTIDYYLLHSLDGPSWDRMVSFGIREWMDSIRASGKVRRMGFSFHGLKKDFMRICDSYDFEFAQVQFNVLDESFQAGIEGIRHAHSRGMGVIVMEPLRGGSLVGNVPDAVQRVYGSANVQREPVDWALRWVLDHPEVTLLLSGMNNDDHIRQNIAIAEDALPDSMTAQENEIVAQVRSTYNDLLQVGCTSCAYCMPCPAGIDIPSAFKNLNNYHMFGRMGARAQHAMSAGAQTSDGKAHWTTDCTDCGKCEKKCPQEIAVRETFKQIQRDLEGPMTKTIAAGARLMLRRQSPENAS